jgi:hypothetical protein
MASLVLDERDASESIWFVMLTRRARAGRMRKWRPKADDRLDRLIDPF